MPITPLHYPLAYGLKRFHERLSFPALVVGGVIPDIEVPILVLMFPHLPDHLLLHSLVGALTVGTILAILVTRFLYEPLIGTLFRLDRKELREACRVTPIMILSCVLGILSHLFIDFPMHTFNPLLWPWIDPYSLPGQLVVLFSGGDINRGFLFASTLTNLIMLIASVFILIRNWGPDLWYRLWLN